MNKSILVLIFSVISTSAFAGSPLSGIECKVQIGKRVQNSYELDKAAEAFAIPLSYFQGDVSGTLRFRHNDLYGEISVSGIEGDINNWGRKQPGLNTSFVIEANTSEKVTELVNRGAVQMATPVYSGPSILKLEILKTKEWMVVSCIKKI